LNALVASDAVLIPMPCEYYALEGLSMLVNTIDRVRAGLNPRLELEGVLVTMFDGRATLTQQVYAEIKKFFGNQTLWDGHPPERSVGGSAQPRDARAGV
jgi:chromosome partitioning protein